jgi:putative flippase GtrA
MLRRLKEEFAEFAATLREGRLPRPVRFLGVGLGGLAVDLGTFHLLASGPGLHPLVARAGSLGVATLFTWFLNRMFTFGASGRRKREEVLRYALVTLGAQGLNYGIFAVLVTGPLSEWPRLALLVGAGSAAFFSYFGHSVFSFAPAAGKDMSGAARRMADLGAPAGAGVAPAAGDLTLRSK